jgi:hypothetical protein
MKKVSDWAKKMVRKVIDNTTGPFPHARIFTRFTDDRGGWVYIPFADLDDVGLTPYSFTAFSRIDKKGMYLEEEMDAEIFIQTYERKTGFRVVLNEVYEESSPIRQKQANKVGAAQELWEKRETPVLRLRVIR